jgi:hypothetical protein
MNLRVVVRHVAAAPKPGSCQAIDRATHVNGLHGGESCDVCADIQLKRALSAGIEPHSWLCDALTTEQ